MKTRMKTKQKHKLTEPLLKFTHTGARAKHPINSSACKNTLILKNNIPVTTQDTTLFPQKDTI